MTDITNNSITLLMQSEWTLTSPKTQLVESTFVQSEEGFPSPIQEEESENSEVITRITNNPRNTLHGRIAFYLAKKLKLKSNRLQKRLKQKEVLEGKQTEQRLLKSSTYKFDVEFMDISPKEIVSKKNRELTTARTDEVSNMYTTKDFKDKTVNHSVPPHLNQLNFTNGQRFPKFGKQRGEETEEWNPERIETLGKWVFNQYSKEKNALSLSEFPKAINELRSILRLKPLEQEDCFIFMYLFDTNKNGRIDLHEFMELLRDLTKEFEIIKVHRTSLVKA